MKCDSEKCNGEIDLTKLQNLQMGPCPCSPIAVTHPCNKCGKLHWDDGTGVVAGNLKYLFLINGKIIQET